MTEQKFEQFVTVPACQQNAIDLFKWVSVLPTARLQSGNVCLFDADQDPRPQMLIDVFGSIDNFNILELGSLEGGHSYQLEQLGAGSILGIEANPELYLKSLIAKESLGHKASFLLGDFNAYMEQSKEIFDLIFTCGVLYHMYDPIHTLYLVSQHTPRMFLWTHYIGEDDTIFRPVPVQIHGFSCSYYEIKYDPSSHSRGWAGVNPSARRMKKHDILRCLEYLGFDKIVITEDAPDHMGGPAITLVAHNTTFDAEKLATADNNTPYQEVEYYRNTCLELRTQVARLNSELTRAYNQEGQPPVSDKAQRTLQEIMNSASWRVTAPLRKGKVVLKKLLAKK